MGKLKNHLRVNFGKIDQEGWNIDSDVDSWAISYIAYNPRLELLEVRFRGKPYVAYTYKDVDVETANRFFAAGQPRMKTHIPRARSLGATFNKVIKLPRIPFSRKVLDNVAVRNYRPGRGRPDR